MNVSAASDPLAPGLTLALRIDSVCREFEESWKRVPDGTPPPALEAHLADVTEPGRAALLVELIRLDAYYRRRQGQSPQPAEYHARFPSLDPTWLEDALAADASPESAITLLPSDSGTSRPTLFHSAPAPADIEGYELLEMLGRGGMGVVYKARHKALNRTVALKMILGGVAAGPEEHERFRREALAVAKLQHPNIVQVYDVGELAPEPGQPALPYLALEYMDGGNLGHHVGGTPQTPADAAHIVAALADAVQHAHDRGIIHRDLKPANVLLGGQEVGGGVASGPTNTPHASPLTSHQPKITDFGLAKDLAATNGQTESGALLGTPQYMAPEQAEGNIKGIGPATDVYALGGILYFLLTGRPPVQGTDVMEVIEQVRFQDPVPPRRLQPRIPRDLETICLKCLAKPPSRRYLKAADLADDLRRFLAGEPIRARPASVWERGVKWARRRPALASAGAAALLASVLLVIVLSVSNLQIRHEQALTASAYAGQIDANTKLNAANAELVQANQRISLEQEQTKKALTDRSAALAQEKQALEREQLTSYHQRIALARNEWVNNNIARTWQHLEECPPALRHWEWHYLLRLCSTEHIRVRPGDANLQAAVFMKGSLPLATMGTGGQVRVVDLITGAAQFAHQEPGYTGWHLVCSPDSKCLAAAFGHPRAHKVIVRVWEVGTWKQLHEWTEENFGVPSLAFSANGQLLAVAGRRGSPPARLTGEVLICDLETGAVRQTLRGHRAPVSSVSFSPDGQTLVSCSNGNEVKLWDVAKGELRRDLPQSNNHLISSAFGARDGRLYLAGLQGGLVAWDLAADQEVARATAFNVNYQALAVSPDGKRLALGARDGTIRLANAQTLQPLGVLRGHEAPVTSLFFHPEKEWLLSAAHDGTVRVWNTSQSQGRAVFRAKPRLLAEKGAQEPPDTVWRHDDAQRLLALYSHYSFTPNVVSSPDGKLELRYTPTAAATAQSDSRLRFFQVGSRTPFQTLEGHAGPPTCSAFSPDGRLLATGASDGVVILWDVMAGKLLHELRGQRLAVKAVAFDGPGKLVAAICGSEVLVWDTGMGQEVRRIQLSAANNGMSCALSPHDRMLAIGHADGTVSLWSVPQGKLHSTLSKHNAAVMCLTYIADGQRLVSIDWEGTGKVWDPKTGREVLTLINPDQAFQ